MSERSTCGHFAHRSLVAHDRLLTGVSAFDKRHDASISLDRATARSEGAPDRQVEADSAAAAMPSRVCFMPARLCATRSSTPLALAPSCFMNPLR